MHLFITVPLVKCRVFTENSKNPALYLRIKIRIKTVTNRYSKYLRIYAHYFLGVAASNTSIIGHKKFDSCGTIKESSYVLIEGRARFDGK